MRNASFWPPIQTFWIRNPEGGGPSNLCFKKLPGNSETCWSLRTTGGVEQCFSDFKLPDVLSNYILSNAGPDNGLPRWLSGKESTYQCRRHGFDPWSGKIPWRRKWQPNPVFLPGNPHGQRSLVGYSPWGHKRVGHNLVTEQGPDIPYF